MSVEKSPTEGNRCFVQVFFSLLMLVGSVSVMAERPHQWETATVVSQNLGSSPAGVYSGPLGTGSIASPINLRSNLVVVETGAYRYTWEEFTRSPNWHHFIVLTVNEEVKFYRDGAWFVVLDSKKTKHKFALIGAAKK
jgi:hypothetical protein